MDLRRVVFGLLTVGGGVILVVVGAVLFGVQAVRVQADRDLELLQQTRDAEPAVEAAQPEPVVWRLLVEVDGTVTHRGSAVSLDALEPEAEATVAEITVEEGAPHAQVAAVIEAVRRAGIADVAVKTEPAP